MAREKISKAATDEAPPEETNLSDAQYETMLAFFRDSDADPDVTRRFAGSNFVINFSTMGRPSSSKSASAKEMLDRHPPSPQDMVIEVLRQAHVIAVNPVIHRDERPVFRAYLDSLLPAFKTVPEEEHQINMQILNVSLGMQYFDALGEAVNDHKGDTYDAKIEIGRRFMAFVGARVLDGVVTPVEDISSSRKSNNLPAAS